MVNDVRAFAAAEVLRINHSPPNHRPNPTQPNPGAKDQLEGGGQAKVEGGD